MSGKNVVQSEVYFDIINESNIEFIVSGMKLTGRIEENEVVILEKEVPEEIKQQLLQFKFYKAKDSKAYKGAYLINFNTPENVYFLQPDTSYCITRQKRFVDRTTYSLFYKFTYNTEEGKIIKF